MGTLSTSGFLVEEAQVVEKTGYKVTVKPPPAPTFFDPASAPGGGPEANAEPVAGALTNAIRAAVQGDDATFANRLQELKQHVSGIHENIGRETK